jgi:hypothetical protein
MRLGACMILLHLDCFHALNGTVIQFVSLSLYIVTVLKSYVKIIPQSPTFMGECIASAIYSTNKQSGPGNYPA